MDTHEQVIKSLRVLGITGDSLFHRIRGELERGNIADARALLNFVDVLLALEPTPTKE